MAKQGQNDWKKVQLTEGILVLTLLDEVCIPALRCGFAGYTLNPRWNGVKIHAWKTGRQWREAYLQGTMVVRSQDSLLVPAEEAVAPTKEMKSNRSRLSIFRSSKNYPSSGEQLSLV